VTRQEQKEATRVLLLRVGRSVFTKHGFDSTSIAMLCAAARTTHGALYHHYPSKTDLFVAVLRELTEEVAGKVQAAAESRTEGGWSQVEAACNAYLEACTLPEVQAIVFRDGPRVLPAATFAKIDHETNEPLVTSLLQRWIDEGLMRPFPVVVVARMLGGAFAEAGAAIAESDNPRKTWSAVGSVLADWIRTFAAT